MKHLAPCLVVVLLISSCATAEKKDKAAAAQEVSSLWTLVADDPPTYIPKGYPAGAPRSKANGEWGTSKTINVRFFVPDGGTSAVSEADCRRSALRAIDPFDTSLKKKRAQNKAVEVAVTPAAWFFWMLGQTGGIN